MVMAELNVCPSQFSANPETMVHFLFSENDWSASTDLPSLSDSEILFVSSFEVNAYPVLHSSGNTYRSALTVEASLIAFSMFSSFCPNLGLVWTNAPVICL